jgi:hypothetical protein
MARVFIDGFEAGDVKLWDDQVGVVVASASTYGMNNVYCCSIPGATSEQDLAEPGV